ncbi:MAG: HAMP domain-containing sensor histidine kinase, partial [Myxococcota bacterium]
FQTAAIEREVLSALESASPNVEDLRRLVRRTPLITQAFWLQQGGALAFPPSDSTQSASERAFVLRTQQIWRRQAILYGPPPDETPRTVAFNAVPTDPMAQTQMLQARAVPTQSVLRKKARRRGSPAGDSLVALAERTDSGWITWYWQVGLHLLLWRRTPDGKTTWPAGGVIGAEVDRVAALARIVGTLAEPANLDGRIVLINGRGDTLAQWGPLEPDDNMVPAARVSLASPLDTWRLLYYPSPNRQAGFMQRSARWSLAFGWGALALAVVGLAFYFYRESDREMRDAAQRVTFVTQVSHELKTPLTNIRLYAELLDRDLEEEEAEGPRRRVAIIVSEAQRLSRLIRNILTFSRQRRGKLTVNPVSMGLNAVVENMVEQFRPALAAVDIEVDLTLAAGQPTFADPDTVDQVVANLLSNVEKYAADGGHVAVATRQDETTSYLTVTDRGPGIPEGHRDRVFLPFYRVSDRLADGVTGTGIGLALSAELARKNGGTLRLLSSTRGAVFELALPRARPS